MSDAMLLAYGYPSTLYRLCGFLADVDKSYLLQSDLLSATYFVLLWTFLAQQICPMGIKDAIMHI